MVVVILMASGALLALRAYNSLAAADPALLSSTVFSIRQGAGVMAALCAAVFAVITALEKGTAAFTGTSFTPPGPAPGSWAAKVASATAPATVQVPS